MGSRQQEDPFFTSVRLGIPTLGYACTRAPGHGLGGQRGRHTRQNNRESPILCILLWTTYRSHTALRFIASVFLLSAIPPGLPFEAISMPKAFVHRVLEKLESIYWHLRTLMVYFQALSSYESSCKPLGISQLGPDGLGLLQRVRQATGHRRRCLFNLRLNGLIDVRRAHSDTHGATCIFWVIHEWRLLWRG